MRRLVLLSGTLLLLTGCSEQPPADDARESNGPPPPPYNESTMPMPDAPPPSEARPSVRTDTILIEGMPEPVQLTLFDAGDRLSPAFSTYVPADLRPEWRPTDMGDGVDFVAHFGDVREPAARLGYFVYRAGMNRAEVNQAVRSFVAERRPRGDPDAGQRFPWSLMELRYEYPGENGAPVVGTIGLGERGGRYFHILVQYPAEYGDGMGPRVHQIIRHWRWADGSPLPF